MDQLEAQGLQTLQNKAESSLARPRLVGSCSLELETPQQVMSQHRDLLPGRVGPVVMGGNDVESPLPLKLAEGLLLRSSSSHEVPQSGGRESHVGGHCRVLKVAVIGVKQIKLVVLPAFMMHHFSVDHHSQGLPKSGAS